MAGATLTSDEYIQHHLTNLTYGRFEDGHWGFAHGGEDLAEMGFWGLAVTILTVMAGCTVKYSPGSTRSRPFLYVVAKDSLSR